MDVVLFRLQNKSWFWRIGFGKRLLKLKGVYATQFARSKAQSFVGYSISGGVSIFIDHIFLSRRYAEEVYEDCVKKWKPADTKNGYIHDDDLILWEYNNGYSKELRNYQDERVQNERPTHYN
jgi:hypothetical protein